MNKVFIIEDDVKINEQLGSFLKRYGYEVATSFDFENIVDIALEENPKIILYMQGNKKAVQCTYHSCN